MKQPKPNVYDTGKIKIGRTGLGVKLPNPAKYNVKVIKGELYDKNSSSTLR